VTDEGALNPQMAKLLKAMGQNVPDSKQILEINPDHALFAAMNDLFEQDKESPVLKEYIELLYDQALLLEGRGRGTRRRREEPGAIDGGRPEKE